MDAADWDNCKIGSFIENRNVLLFQILLILRAICEQDILFEVE